MENSGNQNSDNPADSARQKLEKCRAYTESLLTNLRGLKADITIAQAHYSDIVMKGREHFTAIDIHVTARDTAGRSERRFHVLVGHGGIKDHDVPENSKELDVQQNDFERAVRVTNKWMRDKLAALGL